MRNQPNPALYFLYPGISIYSSVYGQIRQGSTPNVASPGFVSELHFIV